MGYALCMIESEVRARAANARRICLTHGIAQADIAAHVGASQSPGEPHPQRRERQSLTPV